MLRRVHRRRARSGRDRGLGSLRGRRRAQGRPDGEHPLAPLPLGDSDDVVVGGQVAAIGSPFGNQNSLAVGVVVGDGSIDPVAHLALPGRGRDPDRRADQPRQLGRAAARRRGSRDRDQRPDPLGQRHGRGSRVRNPDQRRSKIVDAAPRLGRQVEYAYIGVKTQDLTPGVAADFGFTPRRGALVAGVDPNTPAERAGLRGGTSEREHNGMTIPVGGDVIVRIAGRPVTGSDDVSRIVTYELLPGQTCPVRRLPGREAEEDDPGHPGRQTRSRRLVARAHSVPASALRWAREHHRRERSGPAIRQPGDARDGRAPWRSRPRPGSPPRSPARRPHRPDWEAEPLRARAALVRRVGHVLLEAADEVAASIVAETGKPTVEAFTSELFPCLDAADWLARNLAGALRPERVPMRRLLVPQKRAQARWTPVWGRRDRVGLELPARCAADPGALRRCRGQRRGREAVGADSAHRCVDRDPVRACRGAARSRRCRAGAGRDGRRSPRLV